MFRIEFLLNAENQRSENKSVGSKRQEKEMGKSRFEYQV